MTDPRIVAEFLMLVGAGAWMLYLRGTQRTRFLRSLRHHLEADVGDHPVEVVLAKARGADYVDVSVDPDLSGASELVIASRGLRELALAPTSRIPRLPMAIGPPNRSRFATGYRRSLAAPAVASGDAEFDEAVYLCANPALASAVLDSGTRSQLVSEVNRYPTVLANGFLRLSIPVDENADRAAIRAAVENLVGVLDGLNIAPEEIPLRLAANANGDPLPGVRRRCLGLLQSRFPDHAATAAASLKGRHDADPVVRLQAAVECGTKGLEALRAQALIPSLGERVRYEALRLLDEHGDDGVLRAVDVILRGDSDPMLRAAATIAERRCLPGLADRLASAATGADAETVLLFARILADEAHRIEAAIIACLAPTNDEKLETQLIELLARHGGRDAHAALRDAAPNLGSDVLKARAVVAIERIRERLGGLPALGGRLSVAFADEGVGALAITDEGGALAITDEAGALAITDQLSGRPDPTPADDEP